MAWLIWQAYSEPLQWVGSMRTSSSKVSSGVTAWLLGPLCTSCWFAMVAFKVIFCLDRGNVWSQFVRFTWQSVQGCFFLSDFPLSSETDRSGTVCTVFSTTCLTNPFFLPIWSNPVNISELTWQLLLLLTDLVPLLIWTGGWLLFWVG